MQQIHFGDTGKEGDKSKRGNYSSYKNKSVVSQTVALVHNANEYMRATLTLNNIQHQTDIFPS